MDWQQNTNGRRWTYLTMKKPTDTNAKLDTGLNSEKKKVYKSFADLSQLMDLIVDGHQSCEIYPTSGLKVTEEKKDHGNRPK